MAAEISPQAQKTIEKTVKGYPEAWTGGVCAYAIIDRTTGKDTGGYTTRGACHAGLLYIKNNPVVVNAHKPQWEKVSRDYLLWVAKESPYSHGVLNRDNEKEILRHASVIDTDIVGKGGALWLGKAFRYFVEDTWKPETWDKLRAEGLDGLQAFIGASILAADGSPMVYSHVNLVGYDTPVNLRKVYDTLRKIDRNDTTQAAYTGGGWNAGYGNQAWGDMKGKPVKSPDGWGGFIEKVVPQGAKEFAAQLKEIFEGDPKNVK